MAKHINSSLAAAGFTTKRVPDNVPARNRGFKQFAKSLVAVVLVLGLFVQSVPAAVAQQVAAVDNSPQPSDNPTLSQACGFNVVLVLDSSDSMNEGDLTTVKNAAHTLVDALMPATPTQIGVIDFDTTVISSLNPTSDKTEVLDAVDSIGHTGGNSNELTNWDAALNAAGDMVGSGDLVVIITDGNPTDDDGPGDPLDNAILRANEIKAGDARMLAIGIDSNGNDGGLDQNNLEKISGPQVKNFPGDTITDINDVDVALGDISSLNSTLVDLTTALCGGTITVHKILDADGNLQTTEDQTDGEGWQFTVGNTALDLTDVNGMASTKVDAGNYNVTETPQDGFSFISASCTKGDGTIGSPDGLTVFTVPVGDQDIVSCTFYNRPPSVDEGTTFHFIKQICPSYGDVSGNALADKVDATGGKFVEFKNYSDGNPHFANPYGAKPVSPNEITDTDITGEDCAPAAGWHFNLYTSNPDLENAPAASYTTEATGVDGTVSVALTDLPEDLQDLVNQNGQLWVAEVMQPSEAAFGALRCYNDAKNGDNSEFIQLSGRVFPSDVYCIAYNIGEDDGGGSNPCTPTDLLVNGGFETPAVSGDWNVVASGTAGLGWTVAWTPAVSGPFDGDILPDPAKLELQKTVSGWLPSEGAQYTELDSDWEGPSGNTSGEPANVSISQTVATTDGATYDLSFDFSARPGIVSNSVEVYWNGVLVDTITADGTGNNNTVWTPHNFALTGAAGTSTLEFREVGTPDSLGSFLDNVKLMTNCEGTITGVVYNDLNGNGTQDEEEPQLSGWTVFLDTNDNGELDGDEQSAVTASPYVFSNLPDGSYNVRQVVQNGWSQTQPAGNGKHVAIISGGNTVSDLNFGNEEDSSGGGNGGGGGGRGSGGSSGGSSTTSTPPGQVLGDTTTVPAPQVAGVTELPRTGLPVSALALIVLSAAALWNLVEPRKLVKSK